jgi:hypothetical protein
MPRFGVREPPRRGDRATLISLGIPKLVRFAVLQKFTPKQRGIVWYNYTSFFRRRRVALRRAPASNAWMGHDNTGFQ